MSRLKTEPPLLTMTSASSWDCLRDVTWHSKCYIWIASVHRSSSAQRSVDNVVAEAKRWTDGALELLSRQARVADSFRRDSSGCE